jgi:ABC-type transport system substrate-binding protein
MMPSPLSKLAPISSLACAAALLASLTACHKENSQALRVAVIGEGRLDANPVAADMLEAAAHEGLVALDEQGRVVPALADRWIVTDDGMSYIFRLRDSAAPDGTPLTSESVRNALRQAMAAAKDTPLGLELGVVDEVRAMAGRVVEIRLTHPMPDFLQLMAEPALGLSWRGRGTGPMRIKSKDGQLWLTALPPSERGQPMPENWQATTRSVTLMHRPVDAALADLGAGRVDLVLGGSFADAARIPNGRLSRLQAGFDPVAGLFGLKVENEQGFLALPLNREALAMVIDRVALGQALGIAGFVPNTRLLPMALRGDDKNERWSDYDMEGRQKLAMQRISRWNAVHPERVRLRLALPKGPGADILAARIAQDFGNIGIEIERVNIKEPADLRLLDQVAPYANPAWYFHVLHCRANQVCSTESDILIEKTSETSASETIALYAEAERLTLSANVYMPIGLPLRWSVSAGTVHGFSFNTHSLHNIYPMSQLGN